MDSNLVVTITGPDKIGLVERVSKLVVECHGNIAASRMAHLGTETAFEVLARAKALEAKGHDIALCQA